MLVKPNIDRKRRGLMVETLAAELQTQRWRIVRVVLGQEVELPEASEGEDAMWINIAAYLIDHYGVTIRV